MRLYSSSAVLAAFSEFVVARHLSEHGGNDPGFEGLVDAAVRTGITHVGGPIGNGCHEDFVFVLGSGPRIMEISC